MRFNDLNDSIIGLFQFAFTYLFIYIIFTGIVKIFAEFEIVINSSPLSIPLVFTVIVYFLGVLSRATRTVEHAGKFWERVNRYQGQVYDLKERLELLESQVAKLKGQKSNQITNSK